MVTAALRKALRRKQAPITKVACRPDVGGGSSSSDAAKMAEMAMQDTAMDDLEMDEMFDKHLEEHEAPFDDDQATGRSPTRSRRTCSSATPSSTTWTTTTRPWATSRTTRRPSTCLGVR